MLNWKQALRRGFDAPAPVRKSAFIRRLDPPCISVWEFLYIQMGYVRKWIWSMSALFFVLSILGAAFMPDTVLWLISGLTPLLALTIVCESGRSARCQMEEMEMATRFSLRSVTLARMTILGLMNALILGEFALIGLWSGTAAPLAAFLYIVSPFLLSAFAGLYIVRRYRGQGALYACAGISLGISAFLLLSHRITPFIYREDCLPIWMAAALVLLFANGKQCAAMMTKKEELVWN